MGEQGSQVESKAGRPEAKETEARKMGEKVLAKASTLRGKRGAVAARRRLSGRDRYRSTRLSAAHAWVCGMRAGDARLGFGAPRNALKFGQHPAEQKVA